MARFKKTRRRERGFFPSKNPRARNTKRGKDRHRVPPGRNRRTKARRHDRVDVVKFEPTISDREWMKIAIVVAGRHGDVCNCTPILKYKDRLWGEDAEIHWFVTSKYRTALEHNPHIILRDFNFGAGSQLESVTRKLASIAAAEDFDRIYTPAPYMNPNLRDLPGFNIVLIPARYFGLGTPEKWRPLIYLTEAEIAQANAFVKKLGPQSKVMIETRAFSSQGGWDEDIVTSLMKLIPPNWLILMASFGDGTHFKHMEYHNRVVALDDVPFRQLTQVYNHCEMFFGASSGAACVTCAERCKQIPRLELLNPDWADTRGTNVLGGTRCFSNDAEFLNACAKTIRTRLRELMKA